MTPSARPALAWIAAATTALGMLATAAAPAQAASSVPAASTPAPSASTAPTAAAGTQADPLDSPRWEDMRKSFFADATVVFDERVRVSGPAVAEDSLNVPVSVDASGLPAVEELIVFADFNPIVKALRFEPGAAQPRLGFRIKLQQSSPVRAAARTADGVWHVGGAWVTATGGGCTLPSVGSGSPEWQERLNEVNGKLWPRVDGGERLPQRERERFEAVGHPRSSRRDTGRVSPPKVGIQHECLPGPPHTITWRFSGFWVIGASARWPVRCSTRSA